MVDSMYTDSQTSAPDIAEPTSHADVMDGIYRHQRLIYDATRKYFLLGRDHLIRELDSAPGDSILEVACGTGRNLSKVSQRYPDTQLHGLDLSEQMLKSARKSVGGFATLARGDACTFDGRDLFGRATFDRIIISYGLSMIPDWQGALTNAVDHLAPGGSLHVVDFGHQERLPGWFAHPLNAWLSKFHVQPRHELEDALIVAGHQARGTISFQSMFQDYASYGSLTLSK